MNKEILNASEAEVVHPQEEILSAEEAEVAQPQKVDINNMSDTEFLSYLGKLDDDNVQPVAADEPTEEKEPEVTEQADDDAPTEPPFKTYSTQAEWQSDIDDIIGKRLKENREQGQIYESIVGIAKDFYGDDNPVQRLIQDLKGQAAERQHITPEQYAERETLRQKAQLYDEQMAIQQAQARQQETLRQWQAQAEQVRKDDPDFDFNKALENKEFYDRIVKGYSVADAYKLTRKSPPQTVVQKRKPVAQNAIHAQSGASGEIDINKMSDKDFMRHIHSIMNE